MKLSKWDRLIHVCSKIKEIDPSNIKGVYRMALGFFLIIIIIALKE